MNKNIIYFLFFSYYNAFSMQIYSSVNSLIKDINPKTGINLKKASFKTIENKNIPNPKENFTSYKKNFLSSAAPKSTEHKLDPVSYFNSKASMIKNPDKILSFYRGINNLCEEIERKFGTEQNNRYQILFNKIIKNRIEKYNKIIGKSKLPEKYTSKNFAIIYYTCLLHKEATEKEDFKLYCLNRIEKIYKRYKKRLLTGEKVSLYLGPDDLLSYHQKTIPLKK